MQRFSILSVLILCMIVSNNDYVEARPYKDGDGIEKSENKREHRKHRRMEGEKRKGPMSQLDQEQRTELKQKLKSLRESGASPEAISQAITEEYTTAGIELPENFSKRINRREQKWVERKSQRDVTQSMVKEMKAQGATRKEIRSALKEAGIEKPRGKRRVERRKSGRKDRMN